MKKLIALTLIAFALNGCANKNDAVKALAAQGFSNITITGYDFFGCSDEDFFHTGFIATNQNGDVVTGTVCSGFFKGATIRY